MLELEGPAFDWTPASAQAMEQAFQQARASGERPGVNWTDYVTNVAGSLAEKFSEMLFPLARILGITDIVTLGRIALFLAVLTVVILLIRILMSLRPAARPAAVLPIPALKPDGPAVSAAARRREAETLLQNGDVKRALASVWWWFAETALGSRPEPMMTTNDVLVRSKRTDLRPRARDLDRLRFSSTMPSAADVRGLIASFETSL